LVIKNFEIVSPEKEKEWDEKNLKQVEKNNQFLHMQKIRIQIHRLWQLS